MRKHAVLNTLGEVETCRFIQACPLMPLTSSVAPTKKRESETQ